MPTPKPNETRSDYVERCMLSPHTQKWEHDQRVAVCEHLYSSHAGEHDEHEEQAPVEVTGELFEQAIAEKPRVDRKAGVIYRAHVLGNSSKHGYSYGLDAQKAVVGRFEQMTVGIDHNYQGGPLKVGEAWGTLRNPVVDENGTWADLHYLKTHVRTEPILEDIERGTGIFALSCVNGRAVEKNKVITSFIPSRVDLVAGGATCRTVLEQAPPAETPIVETPTADDNKKLYEQIDTLTAKVIDLEKRLTLREQFVTPQASLEQTIQTVASKYDAKQFWSQTK